MQDALNERKELDEQFDTVGRTSQRFSLERPSPTSPETNPVNGSYSLPDEDEDEKTEDDLILGDEDELSGDEEEYDVVLEDELDEDDIDDDDLVIKADDDDLEDDDL